MGKGSDASALIEQGFQRDGYKVLDVRVTQSLGVYPSPP